jgi:uncharacterized phage protein (predicted DNA packaging)
MALIDDVKLRLRISGDDVDDEISDLIDVAKSDLILSGVLKTDYTDPLIKQAIITYCKANFGWDNPEAERLQEAYDLLKSHLSLVEEYNEVAV